MSEIVGFLHAAAHYFSAEKFNSFCFKIIADAKMKNFLKQNVFFRKIFVAAENN